LNTREFLCCMRHFRVNQVMVLQRVIDMNDADGNGTLSGKEILNTFSALGYIVSAQGVAEAALEAGLDPDDQELDLSELWQLVQVYRWREGLTGEEAADVQQAFKRHDKLDRGEISELDAGKALRWLGFQVSLELLQDMIAQVDVDETGFLDPLELRMLFRKVQDRELAKAREAYEHYRAEMHAVYLDHDVVRLLLSQLGLEFTEDQLLPDLEGVSPLDSCSFLRLYKRLHAERRAALRETGGFSPQALEELQKSFVLYDKDGSGEINQRELVDLVQDVFPTMAHDRERRPELQRLMESVDVNSDGSLGFSEFLHLMGQLQEIEDRERFAQEQAAIQLAGYSKDEVLDFRKLFLAVDTDADGLISRHQAMTMMETICPLGAKNAADFTSIFREVVQRRIVEEGAEEMANFADYLTLMKRLVDVDFAQINERAKTFVLFEEEDDSNLTAEH